MNFKTIGLNVAVATAVVASSALAICPAQAATIGSKLDFFGIGKADFATPKIDFLNLNFSSGASTGQFAVQGTSTGSFAGLELGTIKDIGATEALSLFGGTGVSNFLQAGSETFKLTQLTGFASSTISFEGIFGDGVKGLGTFTVLGNQGELFTYQGSVTAVPTPALLPGLLALGLGVLRKRKAEAIEEVEADA